MDEELKSKVSIAVHETLRRMTANMVMGGMYPEEALEVLETQMAVIRRTVETAVERSKGNDPIADVRVRGAVGERAQAEAPVVEKEQAQQLPVVRGERVEGTTGTGASVKFYLSGDGWLGDEGGGWQT